MRPLPTVTLIALLAVPAAAQQQAARLALTVTVTDSTGQPIEGVDVAVTGPVTRNAATNEKGVVRFINMRAGTYLLRFEGEGHIIFEREVVMRAGQPAAVDVTLSPAPEPPRPPPPAPPPDSPPAAPPVPAGRPITVDIPQFVERNFIGRDPYRHTPLGCAGTVSIELLQFRDPVAEHIHEGAEETIYVVAGEATLTLQGRPWIAGPGTVSLIPRGIPHAFMRRGRSPVVLISVISGEPCAAAATANRCPGCPAPEGVGRHE